MTEYVRMPSSRFRKQLGIDNAKGSIAIGKDADFLVFDNNLLEAEQEGFSHNMPKEVYITGKKVN